MSYLKDLGIVSRDSNDEAISIFENLIKDSEGNIIPFTNVDCSSCSSYIATYWNAYKDFAERYKAEKLAEKRTRAIAEGRDPNKETTNTNAYNGSIFEYIIATLLYRKGILPFYTQAKVAFVPGINYDFILFTSDKNLICLTLKTSGRERVKQADLEAVALRYVHRRSISYFLTLSTREANNQKRKLRKGDFLGLNKIIDCNCESDLISLFEDLNTYRYCSTDTIATVSGHLVEETNN